MTVEGPPLLLAPPRPSRLLKLALAIAGAIALASVGWGVYRGLAADGGRDLQWSGIHILWLGLDPSRTFLVCWPGDCAKSFILSQYPNYPISALMSLLPFGALPWGLAKPVWIAVSLAVTVLLYWCARTELAPQIDGRLLGFGFLLLMISTPYRNQLSNGQEGIFVIAMLVWALRQARRGQPIVAGLLLAFSWFKFTLTFPLTLVFVARRDWRVIATAAAAHVTLTLAAAAWTLTDPFASAFGFFAVAKLAVDYRFGFLDVYSLASHLTLPYAFAAATSGALALAGLWLAWRLGKRDELLLLAVTSLAAMAGFYHLSYDCVIFIFPLLYALRTIVRGNPREVDRLFLVATFVTIGMTWFVNRMVEGNNLGYGFGGAGYTIFYWAMILTFYAALIIGMYRLAAPCLVDESDLPGAARTHL